RALPRAHRRGHRRRVRGHQLGHRRADPSARARLGRPGDQRKLVGWHRSGAAATVVLLNPNWIPQNLGWRLCFGLGAVLGLAILTIRRYVPESPRWLMMHGRFEEANAIVDGIERTVKAETGIHELADPGQPILIRPRGAVSIAKVAVTMFRITRRAR